MAIIFSYPTLSSLSSDDLLLVSDVSVTGKPTKNITVQQIVDLIPGLVPGGGTVTSIGLNFQSTGLTTGGGQSETIVNTGDFNIAGTLAQGHGGTGISTYSTGQLFYTNSTSEITLLNPSSQGDILSLDANLIPEWTSASPSGVTQITTTSSLSGITLTSTPSPITGVGTIDIDGTLGLANGGTNSNSQQGALDEITAASSGTAGQVLITDGANASWGTLSSGVTSWSGGSTGLLASGTDPGTGAVVLSGQLNVNSGGTGLTGLAGSDTGSMFWYNNGTSTTALQKLGIGTLNQVLTVANNGGTLEPEWSDSTISAAGNTTEIQVNSNGNFAATPLLRTLFSTGAGPNKQQFFVGDVNNAGAGYGELVLHGYDNSTNGKPGVIRFYTGNGTLVRIFGQGDDYNDADSYDLYLPNTSPLSSGKSYLYSDSSGQLNWAGESEVEPTWRTGIINSGGEDYLTLYKGANANSSSISTKLSVNQAGVNNLALEVSVSVGTTNSALDYSHTDVYQNANPGQPLTIEANPINSTDANGRGLAGIKDITIDSAGHISGYTINNKWNRYPTAGIILGDSPNLAVSPTGNYFTPAVKNRAWVTWSQGRQQIDFWLEFTEAEIAAAGITTGSIYMGGLYFGSTLNSNNPGTPSPGSANLFITRNDNMGHFDAVNNLNKEAPVVGSMDATSTFTTFQLLARDSNTMVTKTSKWENRDPESGTFTLEGTMNIIRWLYE